MDAKLPNHSVVYRCNLANMSFNAIHENKILRKISEFTIHCKTHKCCTSVNNVEPDMMLQNVTPGSCDILPGSSLFSKVKPIFSHRNTNDYRKRLTWMGEYFSHYS